MDRQKPSADRGSYAGRFGDAAPDRSRPAGAYQPRGSHSTQTRRPSGFSNVGQTHRSRPAPAPAPQPEPEDKRAAKLRAKQEKRERKAQRKLEKQAAGKRRWPKALLIILGVLMLLFVLFVIIFGGEDAAHHQMPTIERESAVGSYEPEETPLPGTEET